MIVPSLVIVAAVLPLVTLIPFVVEFSAVVIFPVDVLDMVPPAALIASLPACISIVPEFVIGALAEDPIPTDEFPVTVIFPLFVIPS